MPAVALSKEDAPAEPSVETTRSGRLILVGDRDHNPVAAADARPGDRMPHQPAAEALVAAFLADSQFVEPRPAGEGWR